jgi:phosphatidylglycerol:prolipoprotein diacylglycerol transferase
MLPNLSLPPLTIYGPFKVYPFGAMVAIALIIGYQLGIVRAGKTGLDLNIFADAGIWAIGIGFVVSHLFWAVFYNFHLIIDDPLILFMIWKGISSYGGFFGGALGGWIYLRKKNVSPMAYLETMLFGFVPAWVIARFGCTMAFDHPGRTTSFFLGMADKSGVVRHNLGLYEALWTIVIVAVIYALRNYYPFRGFHLTLVVLLYSPVRFFFDTLRIADRTYLGFTPGQYFSVVAMVVGINFLVKGMKEMRRST